MPVLTTFASRFALFSHSTADSVARDHHGGTETCNLKQFWRGMQLQKQLHIEHGYSFHISQRIVPDDREQSSESAARHA